MKEGKKSKDRLDKYYYLAKEQGYRARSAFKLIQLNRKYRFLDSARVLVDLGAAPGGWLQVASKFMPVSHLIVGIDLVPIKPISGVLTFVSDFTSEACRSLLRKELKGWQADVVLHDGAPNMGSSWVQDAYSQSELVLLSMRIATEFLKEGGVFVTKVFRSKDYNSLIWVFSQLFKTVQATKPLSSRTVSAEIFVVCKGYLAPKHLDPKFLDPKNVFQEVSEPRKGNVFDLNKKSCEGYDGKLLLFHAEPLGSFVESTDPISFLETCNRLELDDPRDKRYLESKHTTPELLQHCNDLKVLGKRELKRLLSWRIKLQKEAVGPQHMEEAVEEEMLSDSEMLSGMLANETRRGKREEKKRLMKKAKERVRQRSKGVENQESDENLFGIRNYQQEHVQRANLFFSRPLFQEFDQVVNSVETWDEPKWTRPKKVAQVFETEFDDQDRQTLGSAQGMTLALQLRRNQGDVIDESFNRHTFDDEPYAPAWFKEDEKRYNIPVFVPSKEAQEIVKEKQRHIGRQSKKELEAKWRNKNRETKRRSKLQAQLGSVLENEDLTESQKSKAVRRLAEKPRPRSRARLVVTKRSKARPRRIKGKYKLVDARMKKDVRGRAKKR